MFWGEKESTLKGVAIVTGGAKRLGREICLKLAQEGYDIALHYNSSDDEANKVKGTIEALGQRCCLVQGNLVDPAFQSRLVRSAQDALGELTLLINNASQFDKIAFEDTTPNDFDRYFGIHVKAPFFLSQTFATRCAQGAIVNLLDARVERYPTEHFIYTLTKKSLKDLTLLLAKTLAPKIRVNGICPGPILAPESLGEDYLARMAKKTPMERPGQVGDILSALFYLTESTYVNGEILFVDGGERLV